MRSASIWAEVSPETRSVAVKYYKATDLTTLKTVVYSGPLGKTFNPVKMELNGLQMNTRYNYQLVLDGKVISLSYPTAFTTKDLWEYRKPAPDFNFLAGSCAYFNEREYDRPGNPYGKDSSIFITMANTPAAFNLWLGDSWYTREVDYSSAWGLNYRVARDRSLRVVQKFMATMPQYFIWDDHDYGPNNSGKEFIFKETSRKIFRDYTLNPTYGEEEKGIYSKVSFSDVDLFFTDNRFFRSNTRIADSINGLPNPAKTYFGSMQMNWLKNALLYSNATFKIIVTGGQVLNPVSTAECMRFYSYEFNELISFLTTHKVNGVLFFSGDRHHSEVIKLNRQSYPLYDITISPLTASVGTLRGGEITNPARVAGTLVEAQNFGNISVSGEKNNRKLSVKFVGLKGDKLAEWGVVEGELKSEK